MGIASNRRTLLAAMGLAPLGIGAEAFVTKTDAAYSGPPAPGLGYAGNVDDEWAAKREQIAQALERLAAEVRSDRVSSSKLEVRSTVQTNEWNKHEVVLTIEYLPDWNRAV